MSGLGLALVVKGVSAPKGFGYTPPYIEGMKYLFLPGEGSLAKNYAPDGVDGLVRGAPSIVDGKYANLGGSAYIETGIPETADLTLVVVGKYAGALPGGNGYFISNNSSSGQSLDDVGYTSTGTSLYWDTNAKIDFTSARAIVSTHTNVPGTISFTSQDPSSWRYLEGRSRGTAREMFDRTNVLTASAADLGTYSRSRSNGTFRIGSNIGTGDTGIHVFAAAIFDRAITDAESSVFRSALNLLAAVDGITF